MKNKTRKKKHKCTEIDTLTYHTLRQRTKSLFHYLHFWYRFGFSDYEFWDKRNARVSNSFSISIVNIASRKIIIFSAQKLFFDSFFFCPFASQFNFDFELLGLPKQTKVDNGAKTGFTPCKIQRIVEANNNKSIIKINVLKCFQFPDIELTHFFGYFPQTKVSISPIKSQIMILTLFFVLFVNNVFSSEWKKKK